MKRILHIIFAGIILASSMGITVHTHFCRDILKEISLFKPSDVCCSKPCSNCENKSITVKTDSDYIVVEKHTLEVLKIHVNLYLAYNVFASYLQEQAGNTKYFRHAKPPPLNNRLSMLQCFLC